MHIENVNPSDETLDETVETSAVNEDTTQQGVDDSNFESIDNISQLREYAKGLKSDLGTYKPAHEFLTSTFGDLEVAKQAHAMFERFTGEEFNSDEFVKYISELSPNRSTELVEKLASERAKSIAQQEVEKLFGGNATPEEIKMFKEWKDSGFGLADKEDIPEELKFNEDGTPKSEKEIQFLRDLQQQVKTLKQQNEQKAQLEEQARELTRQQEIDQRINEFSNERLKILDKEFEAYNLNPLDTDTADQRAEKEFIRDFIVNGVSGAFLRDPEATRDYNTALKHIKDGEPILARKYEARIETKLLSIMRNNSLGKLFESLVNSSTKINEPRPDISKSGGSKVSETTPKGRVTGDDIFKALVERGQIKPE